MKIIVKILFLSTLILTGCSDTATDPNPQNSVTAENDTWEESPVFELTATDSNNQKITNKFRGKKGHIAFTNGAFVVGKPHKYMWLFWGNADELVGKKVRIVAESKNTGTKIDIPLLYDHLGGENWGATAHLPTNISLPSEGLWRLNVFIDDKLFGQIIVQVKNEP